MRISGRYQRSMLCIWLVMYGSSVLIGQIDGTSNISGTVVDHISLAPLPFVNVYAGRGTQGAVTDSAGHFKIMGLVPGIYVIEASYVGYQRVLSDSIVFDGRIIEQIVDFEMEERAVALSHEVIVTGSRKEQYRANVPSSVSVVQAIDMVSQQVQTFDQAFNLVSGVQVTRSSGANVQALSIRGASEVAGGGIGNRVLFLIDGRPSLSPESGGALWNLVPLQSIDHIEVVKGAYSSLYGSSAMGGVINVITRTPDAKLEGSAHAHYGFYGAAPAASEYGQQGKYYGVEANLGAHRGDWQYLVDGSFKTNDGHRENSSFDLYNTFGKIVFKPNVNDQFVLSTNYNRIKNDAPATWLSTRQAYSVAAHRKDDTQDRQEFNVDLNYQSIRSGSLKYFARTFYYRNYSIFSFNAHPEDRSRDNVNFGKQSVDLESVRTSRLGASFQMDYYTKAHNVTAGVDLKKDRVNGVPDTVLYGKHQAWEAGFYIQDELILNDQFALTYGVRYDYFDLKNATTVSRLSPKIAAVYKPSDDIAVRVLLAQAFRNPSMAERFIKFEQGGGLRFVPNPSLLPEKLNLSFETGLYLDWSKTFSTDFALYYNRYKDLISFQQVADPSGAFVFKVVNLSEAVMQGLELEANYHPADWLRINLAYTYLDAQDVSDRRVNNHLAYKIKHTLGANVRTTFGDWSLHGNARYRSAVKEVFIYPGSEPEAYVLFGGKIGYQITESLSSYISIDNITDTQYEELERYRMPGRGYQVGLKVDF